MGREMPFQEIGEMPLAPKVDTEVLGSCEEV